VALFTAGGATLPALASGDRVFRCGKCGYVYTDDPDVDRSRCPQCRCINDAMSF